MFKTIDELTDKQPDEERRNGCKDQKRQKDAHEQACLPFRYLLFVA